MAQFTQLGLSGEPKKPEAQTTTAGAKTRSHFNQKQKTNAFIGTVVAGALAGIFLLQAGGCSKQESKPVASAAANGAVSNAASTTTAANLPPTPVQSAAPVKKVVKKRPMTVSYQNQDYGLSFRYPRKYRLDPTEDESTATSETVAMNFVQPGGISVTRLEVPKDLYSGTDLASASFEVNVNKLLTVDECYQFAVPAPNSADDPASPPTQVKLGGMEFEEVENLDGPLTQQTDAKFYHVYDNGACYEFALGIETDGGTEDDLVPVNREVVFGKLEKILATVKIKTQAVPDLTASTPQPTVAKEITK
jgi:hypothetical protein